MHISFRPYGWLPDERLAYFTPALSQLPDGSHHWQVKAVDKDGQKRSSGGPSHFTIEAPQATTVFVNHLGYNPMNRSTVHGVGQLQPALDKTSLEPGEGGRLAEHVAAAVGQAADGELELRAAVDQSD